MNSYGITDKGKVRHDNQDSYLIERLEDRDGLVAVVCDGMGGQKAGNVASELAARTFMDNVMQKIGAFRQKQPPCETILRQACSEANYMVYSYSCFDKEYTGMGTTLVAALILGDKTYVINVGDSRAYKITKNKIKQLTKDHSLVQEMVDRGEITPEEAKTHPMKNVITQALGVNSNVPCDIFKPRMFRGDRLLLCSDGLTNMVSDREMLDAAQINTDTLSLGNELMYRALDRGARDNVTVVVITK